LESILKKQFRAKTPGRKEKKKFLVIKTDRERIGFYTSRIKPAFFAP